MIYMIIRKHNGGNDNRNEKLIKLTINEVIPIIE